MAQEEANAAAAAGRQQQQQQQQQDNGQRQALSYSSATRRAGQFKCAGAIRKAGFLSVKKWILKRRQSIELARKQGWRRYWVCLRGTALLFHSVIDTKQPGAHHQADSLEGHQKQVDLASWIRANCSSQLNVMAGLVKPDAAPGQPAQESLFQSMSQCYIEEEPRHLIIIDGAIAQPIPEHPRRDFVFCLSTTFGDAYLFQASCQLESDNWISAIHNACAASIARDLIRDEAIKLFETKIRHFELEAEKKLFLRHRLESRLTSMSSMCNVATTRPQPDSVSLCSGKENAASQQQAKPEAAIGDKRLDNAADHGGKKKMRSLLCQLGQQLLALDSYIEQLHCEIYQLRCYLSSCSAQNIFYHNLISVSGHSGAPMAAGPIAAHSQHDLPHPKSLLMHVSKPTKLLLIKLGVFTVSSFHAFIHARQESAKGILETIQQQSSCPESPIVELRIRSRSISETLMSRPENVQLASKTETLIELANLRTTPIVLSRWLFNKIRGGAGVASPADVSDGCDDLLYSFQDRDDESIQLDVKLNSSSTSSSIIRQVLQILRPDSGELEFLNYYLRLVVVRSTPMDSGDDHHLCEPNDDRRKDLDYVVVKRKETLSEWSNYSHIELLEKMLFRVKLARSRLDEEESAAPFGISFEGQLLSSKSESLLNVYCSYVEWGSAADKAGLQDEDEFLMINGIPVGDLDLMFVECIVQDTRELRAVVRSNRYECPAKGRRLDRASWRSLDGDGDGTADGERADPFGMGNDPLRFLPSAGSNNQSFVSQVISDEYLTSLMCPPPPAKSSAFLRTDTNLLRQKSDLGLNSQEVKCAADEDDDFKGAGGSGQAANATTMGLPKSKSQHRLDASQVVSQQQQQQASCVAAVVDQAGASTGGGVVALKSSADLAQQLMQKTERITRLLGKPEDTCVVVGELDASPASQSSKSAHHNQVERLKKSILELIETEYAYIRHLETIHEHYMAPLCETSFLNVFDLGAFSQTVVGLLSFQRSFFSLLTRKIFEQLSAPIGSLSGGEPAEVIDDDFERFNWIVQQADSFESVGSFRPLLVSIAGAFLSESDKFKIYASYCVAYSRLQRILHPKNAAHFQGASSTIVSIPNTLSTFASSLSSSNMSGIGQLVAGPHRDMKLFNLIGGSSSSSNGAEDRAAQLKQLAEFLANLDSSSSSASFSLQRSSTPERPPAPPLRGAAPAKSQAGRHLDSKASSSDCSNNDQHDNRHNNAYQKSAHHQNFESYLIKPIQRLVKYPMLLNSIALAVPTQSEHESPEAASSFQRDFHTAIKQFETVVNHVNESQRIHDEYGTIFDHIERQFFEQQALDSCNKSSVANLFGPHQPPITLNIAKLLYSGPVVWLNLNDFTTSKTAKKAMNLSSVLFVFESCVVFICKEQIGKASGGGGRKKTPSKSTTNCESGANHQTGMQQQHQQQQHTQQSAGLTSKVLQWSTGTGSSGATGGGGSEQVGSEIVRYQTLIPVSEVQVRSVCSDSSGKRKLSESNKKPQLENDNKAQFDWELFQCSSSNSNSSLLTNTPSSGCKQPKHQQAQQQQQQQQLQQQQSQHRNSNTGRVYLLASPSNEERSAFLRKIRFTIRESVRNMSLPTAGSTKSSFSYKSLALKKLSTSSASSATSNTSVNTSGSLSPPESSGGPDLMTQDQSTTIKCEPYNAKKVRETSIEVRT